MTTDPAAAPGSYRFTDHSVLRPWLTRMWFARLFPLLPRWLAANVVTLISTGTLAVVIVASFFADWLGPTRFALLQLVALQLYVAGDHLDGMQAVASGTTSPLGEFLDHHCDLWAGCVLCFGYWSLAGTAPTWVLYLLTVLLIAGFAITYAERAERKSLHFTAWGTLEVIAILTAFYLSWCIPAVRGWWTGELVPGLARHIIPVIAAAAIAIGAIVVIARRLERLPVPLMVNVATLVLLALWFVRSDTMPLLGWGVVVLTGADYVALVMQAHCTPRARPWPDFVPPAATLALWVLPGAGASLATVAIVFMVLTLWLVIRYAVTLTRIISRWRHHWVWMNARPKPLPQSRT